MIRFIEGDYVKRLLVEVMSSIKKLGGIFLQFKTFTYLQVLGSLVCPKKLPRYPSNHLILIEIVRHILTTYDKVRSKKRKIWNWS